MNLYWRLKATSKRRCDNQVYITQTVVRKNNKNNIIYTLPITKWAVAYFHNIKKYNKQRE